MIILDRLFVQKYCVKYLLFFTSHLEKFIILQNVVIKARIYKKFLLSYKNNAMKNS